MPNTNDPFDALFNNAMQATAQNPVPVPGGPFYPVFAQARQSPGSPGRDGLRRHA